MIIYKVTNKINGKVYVGQTIHSLEHRKSGHERDARCQKKTTVKFHNALLKYGFESFDWEVLKECVSQEELDYWEDYYIKEFDCLNRDKGYNLKSGGKVGNVYTDELREKIGETTKEKWKNPELAERMLKGLRKGTETAKRKAENFYIDFECPYCHKVIKMKPWQAKNRKYCSQECANEAKLKDNIKHLELATEINKENYEKVKDERYTLILEWLNKNKDLVINCKMNKLTFLNDLASFINVKDTRTVGKVLGVSGKKDIILKLKELIKMYAVPSDD